MVAANLLPIFGNEGIMMYLHKIMIVLLFPLLLIGCGTDSANDSTKHNNQSIELTNTAANSPIDQQPANQAKRALSQYDGITSVKAVNTKDELLIAVEIEHHRRFKLENTRNELTKQMKKQFPNLKVELSTDQKINLELEKLEKELQSKAIPKKELTKEIKQLIKLTKEKT